MWFMCVLPSVARKVVSETVHVIVHFDNIQFLKQTTNADTSFRTDSTDIFIGYIHVCIYFV